MGMRLAVVAAAIAGAAVLAGCGGNETVASVTPALGTGADPTSEAAAGTDSPGTGRAGDPDGSAEPSGEHAGEDSDNPDPDGRRSGYLRALNNRGVTYDGSGEVAVGTATYICAADAEGAPEADVRVLVTAMVAQEAQLVGASTAPETLADIYFDAAREHYC